MPFLDPKSKASSPLTKPYPVPILRIEPLKSAHSLNRTPRAGTQRPTTSTWSSSGRPMRAPLMQDRALALSAARRRCGSQAARCRTLLCRLVLCGVWFCAHLSLCTLYGRRADQYCHCCHVMGLGLWVVACEHNIYTTYRTASDPVRRRWRAPRRPTAQILAGLHRGTWKKGGSLAPEKPLAIFYGVGKKFCCGSTVADC